MKRKKFRPYPKALVSSPERVIWVDADIPEEYYRTAGWLRGSLPWCEQIQKDRDRGVWGKFVQDVQDVEEK